LREDTTTGEEFERVAIEGRGFFETRTKGGEHPLDALRGKSLAAGGSMGKGEHPPSNLLGKYTEYEGHIKGKNRQIKGGMG